MNSMMVHLLQLVMIYCVWKYITLSPDFEVLMPISHEMMIARFLASVLMHINVEKDLRSGLFMMKYCINHYDHFVSVYPPFLLSFLSTCIAIIIEINVLIILSSI